MKQADKYELAKQEITAIYHGNRGQYGYRRIAMALHGRNMPLNRKTVQQHMKELGLPVDICGLDLAPLAVLLHQREKPRQFLPVLIAPLLE